MEEKQDLMERVFSWVEAAAQNVEEFAAKEIPPFIEEFLMWRFLDHGISVCVWVILTIIPVIVALIYKKYWTFDGFDDHPTKCIPSAIIVFVLGLISLLNFGIGSPQSPSTIGHIKQMVKIKVAPKVYLVEEAAEIIKKAKQ